MTLAASRWAKLGNYIGRVRKLMSQNSPVATVFQYSRLPENNIRLLRIKSIGNPPICELYDAPLNDDLRFRAISYAWGSDKLTHRIKCNDMIMNVTESVADMFTSTAISALCVDMPIWVDAVCINQGDESEKAVQVRMMGSLYSRAEEVIVWLGAASDDSDYAMKQLNDWSSNKTFLTADSLTKLMSDRQYVLQAGLKHQDDPVYNALEALFCRSWFTRLWVLQEIVLAQRCRLFCGSAEITLEQLVSVSGAMTRLLIYAIQPKTPHTETYLKSMNTVFQMGSMKQARGNDELSAMTVRAYMGDIPTLAELMKFGDEKKVSNPHDCVYGLIGLATPEARERISIDYSDRSPTGWSKTYLQCAKVCIQEDPSLTILSLLSNRPKGLPLPSWCPNFNAIQNRQLSLSERPNAGTLKLVEPEDGLPKAWVEENKDILYAPGCQIDLVKEIVRSTLVLEAHGSHPEESEQEGVRNLAWERQCQSLSQQTLGATIETDLIYIKTLIENDAIPGKEDADLRGLLDLLKHIWSEASWDVERTFPTVDFDAVFHFHGKLAHACKDRMFFSTKGGRIGIGPPETRPGDLVCILYGAKPLYLLRRGHDGKKPLQILGDAFVHGCMDLDDMYEQVRSSYEVFEIG